MPSRSRLSLPHLALLIPAQSCLALPSPRSVHTSICPFVCVLVLQPIHLSIHQYMYVHLPNWSSSRSISYSHCSCLVIIIILARSITNRYRKTKTAFFFKLSHNMGHMTILACILFGGDLGGHLGLVTNFLKTIRWP